MTRVSPARLDPSLSVNFEYENALLTTIKDYWQERGFAFDGYIVNNGFDERARGAVLGIRSETINGLPLQRSDY